MNRETMIVRVKTGRRSWNINIRRMQTRNEKSICPEIFAGHCIFKRQTRTVKVL